MPATEVRAAALEVLLNGVAVERVQTARVSLGYDMAVGEFSLQVAGPVPTSGTYFDDVTINVDGTNWFSGVLLNVDYNLYPQSVTLTGKGRLWLLQQYRLTGAVEKTEGLSLNDLMGTSTHTDENIVQAVLERVGVSTLGGVIGGTGTVLGTVAPEEFAWRDGETALDYILRIDSISLGYRTFETTGGVIFRTQLTTRPSGTPDFTFTEGVDIREGVGSRTVQDAYNAVRIGGYAVGDYADPRVWYQAESNPFQTEADPRVFVFNSSMIERRANASPGQGISCQATAEYWLGEVNREIVKLTMTTPRLDDIGPGQAHLVQAAGGLPGRLGIGELLWVQRVDKSYGADGMIEQTIQYVGGGTT